MQGSWLGAMHGTPGRAPNVLSGLSASLTQRISTQCCIKQNPTGQVSALVWHLPIQRNTCHMCELPSPLLTSPLRFLHAAGMKKGGQALLGGLDICVSRNFFGAQVNSFETQLPAHPELQQYGTDSTFRAVFIRAPAVVDAGPEVEVLAQYRLKPEEAAAQGGKESVAVAVRQGPLMATAFHPELTKDSRW